MISGHLRWVPSRAQKVIVEYARPALVEWKFPDVGMDEVQIAREEQYGLLTGLCSCWPGRWCWAVVGQSIREWSVTVLKKGVILGLTNHPRPWVGYPSGTSCRIKISMDWISGRWFYCLEQSRLDCSRGLVLPSLLPAPPAGGWLAYDEIYSQGTRFTFFADSATNVLTVCFQEHRLQSVVPDLASYRPFCFLVSERDPQVAFETL